MRAPWEPYCWVTTPKRPGKKQLVRHPVAWEFVWKCIVHAAEKQAEHFRPARNTNPVWGNDKEQQLQFFRMGHAVQAAYAHLTGLTWVITPKRDGGFDFDLGVGVVDCKGCWANSRRKYIRVPARTLDHFDEVRGSRPGFYVLGEFVQDGQPATITKYATAEMVRAATQNPELKDPTCHELKELLPIPESGIPGPWQNQF